MEADEREPRRREGKRGSVWTEEGRHNAKKRERKRREYDDEGDDTSCLYSRPRSKPSAISLKEQRHAVRGKEREELAVLFFHRIVSFLLFLLCFGFVLWGFIKTLPILSPLCLSLLLFCCFGLFLVVGLCSATSGI